MGCSCSNEEVDDRTEGTDSSPIRKVPYSKVTRIIEEDEVDHFINDEYDKIDSEWEHFHGNFQIECMQLLEAVGEWKVGISAGGSRNNVEMFSMNPQFLLTLGPPEKHPSGNQLFLPHFGGMNVLVCLTQTSLARKPLHVAFFIYRTDNQFERLTAEYFLCVPPEGSTGAFVNWRQIRQNFKLSPGLYIIIPATFRSGLEGLFTISLKAPPPASLKQLPNYKPNVSRQSSIAILRESKSCETKREVGIFEKTRLTRSLTTSDIS